MNSNYILGDTIANTLKSNNQLVRIDKQFQNKYNRNYIFDFSLLEQHINDNTALEDIKNQCMKFVSVSTKFIPVFKSTDICMDFETYSGNLYFQPHIVYSNSKNKRMYVILQLVKIEYLTFQNRHSLYDEYKVVKQINEQITYGNESIEYDVA